MIGVVFFMMEVLVQSDCFRYNVIIIYNISYIADYKKTHEKMEHLLSGRKTSSCESCPQNAANYKYS